MGALFGVVDDDQDEAPPVPQPTVQERVWAALTKPMRRDQLRRVAIAIPGGTEGQADRYLDLCVKGGTVVAVGGQRHTTRYQRVDCAPASALPEPRQDARPALVVERPIPGLDDEDDDTADEPELDDDDQDDGDDNEAPLAPVRRTMGRKPGEIRLAVIEAVRAGHSSTGQIAEAAGISKSRVHNVCNVLVGTGAIVRVERGRYVVPGKAAARPSPAPKAKAPRKPAARAAIKPFEADAFDKALVRVIETKTAYDAAKRDLVASAGGAS